MYGDQAGANALSATHQSFVLTRWTNDLKTEITDISSLETTDLMNQKTSGAVTKTLNSIGGNNKIRFKSKMNIAKQLGLKDVFDDEENYILLNKNFSVNTAPPIGEPEPLTNPEKNNQCYWHLRTLSGSTVNSLFAYTVEMRCKARFSHPAIYSQPVTTNLI